MNDTARRLFRTWWGAIRRPGFLLLTSLNLALGVAATVGAFTLVDSLILHPLPFPDRDRVVLYGERAPDGPVRYASPMLYQDVGLPDTIESRGIARMPESTNVSANGIVFLTTAQRMDAGFLPTLGVRPAMGQGLSGKADEALLSHDFWVRRWHADPDAIGKTLTINGRSTTIRGILPADYRLFTDVDLLLPLDLSRHAGDNAANMNAVARLKPGVDAAAFSREVVDITRAHAATLRIGPERLAFHGATPLDAQITGEARPSLWMFFACSLAVLSIAGLNLSNLLLVRAVARSREVATLIALGAHGWRSWISAIGEASLIGLLATLVGIPLGGIVADVFSGFLPDEWMISPRAIRFDWHDRLFGVAIAALTLGIAFVAGSLHERSEALLHDHVSAGRGFVGGPAGRRARWGTNVLQTALAVVLLLLCLSTGIRLRTLDRVPMGFDADGAKVFEIKADDAQFPRVQDVVALFEAVSAKLAAHRGIDAVGMSNHLPAGGSFVMPFAAPDGSVRYTQYALATPGALQAMGLHLVSGRYLGAADVQGAARVAVVNEAYLKAFAVDGVGADVVPASKLSPNAPLRIVGVVGDTRHAGPALPPEPTVFVPLAQAWESSFDFIRLYMPTYIVVRGAAAEALGTDEVRDAIHGIAPYVAAAEGRPMRADVSAVTADYRRDAAVSATFALFALLLACTGLYSSQSVEVVVKRHDFALRSALGATPTDLAAVIVSRNVRTAVIGACLGLGCSLLAHQGPLGRVWAPESPVDVAVASSACAAMLIAAVAASGLPAWRAARIDPIHVIREG
ncbi:ABC transporter permease [Luteibacter aegosomatis]|uniref:ABC transporter permease n=1 Tax=Luteibacter aegosomatis TaxID=2911537 RepID=UPI001FF9652F|nr:ABC transporter permease [Luteibacter aegosomatis]UPG85884.1 ABC transporter permease [Luteibacter aegosomatis]